MTPTLELDRVRKAYGDFVAVDDVSLTVPPGSVFGFLGPNGAGKSTTIRMVMDIIAPDSGEVRLFGRRRRPEDLLKVGYLPEERGLYRKMTVLDHLVFLGELRGLSRHDARQKSRDWLDRLELADRAGSKVEELSKGMQQKIQLAATVLHEPEILILDEPFSGLDPINQGLFKDLLADYRARGKTILFSTHVMEQAEKLCDHICLIARGRVILEGPLAEVKRRFGGSVYQLRAGKRASALDRPEGLPDDASLLSGMSRIPGVEHAGGGDGSYRLTLGPKASGADALRELMQLVDVEEFRSDQPALNDIFIKAVRDAH